MRVVPLGMILSVFAFVPLGGIPPPFSLLVDDRTRNGRHYLFWFSLPLGGEHLVEGGWAERRGDWTSEGGNTSGVFLALCESGAMFK